MNELAGGPFTVFLCGDVMTGRGVDQILQNPGDPVLYERWVSDARQYVRLAERHSGPIPRSVQPEYIWGEALDELERVDPALRVINLETAVTKSDMPWPGKGIHYRMHPANVASLKAAGVSCCVLANNHVLDWGTDGLQETIDTLQASDIQTTGAGSDIEQARRPAVAQMGKDGRMLVFSAGSPTAGVPLEWAAGRDSAGVWLIDERSRGAADEAARIIAQVRRQSDVVVFAMHWGPNWGYEITAAQRRFAHAVIEQAEVDIVYGHSSHHVKGLEIYQGSLILYGCGDFLNDYEGIEGHEQYRDHLGLMYFPTFEPGSQNLVRLEMCPTRIHRMRIERAAAAQAEWLLKVLRKHSLFSDGKLKMTEQQRIEISLT